jgi:hypothetical protein
MGAGWASGGVAGTYVGGTGRPAGAAECPARAFVDFFADGSARCVAGAAGSVFATGSGAGSGFGALTGASVSVTGCAAGEAALALAAAGAGAAVDAGGASDTVRRVAT